MSVKTRKSSFALRYVPLALGLFAAGCAQVVTPISQQSQLAALGDGFQLDRPASLQVARLREAALRLGNVCLVPESVLIDPEYNPLFCVWERSDTYDGSGDSESAASSAPEQTTEVTSVDEPMDDDYPEDQGVVELR